MKNKVKQFLFLWFFVCLFFSRDSRQGVLISVVIAEVAEGIAIEMLADSFRLPAEDYKSPDSCLGWGGYNSNPNLKGKHVADDYCSQAGTQVVAIADGVRKFASDSWGICDNNWVALTVIEHTLPNGEALCGIYGHVRPLVGPDVFVKKGDVIGEMIDLDCTSDHIHFGIYKGSCGSSSVYPSWIQGYVPENEFPGKYTDPVRFVAEHEVSYRLHPAGTILKCEGENCGTSEEQARVYQLAYENGLLAKRHIQSYPAFMLRNWQGKHIVSVTARELSWYADGAPLLIPSGAVLVRIGGERLIVDTSLGRAEKRRVKSSDYGALGFGSAYLVYDSEIDDRYYPWGADVAMENGHAPMYPDGVLVKSFSQSTVFQIHSLSGGAKVLVAVLNWPVFVNNFGELWDVVEISDDEIRNYDKATGDVVSYQAGTLIAFSGRVFIVSEERSLEEFSSWDLFHYLGYQDSNLVNIAPEEWPYFEVISDHVMTFENSVVFGSSSDVEISNFLDSDSDGVSDEEDNCPLSANEDQKDGDADGVGDVCESETPISDMDFDGVPDGIDICEDVFNPGQEDVDADGVGDACDDRDDRAPDVDKDGISDNWDNCSQDYNPAQEDKDGDGYGDVCDQVDNTQEAALEFVASSVSRSEVFELAEPILQQSQSRFDISDASQSVLNFSLVVLAQTPDAYLSCTVMLKDSLGNEKTASYFLMSDEFHGVGRQYSGVGHAVFTADCSQAGRGAQTLTFSASYAGKQYRFVKSFEITDNCYEQELDSDGDGVSDSVDNCVGIQNSDQINSDADSLGNACDGCPQDSGKTDSGVCGCGKSDADSDRDGSADCNDGCPWDDEKTQAGVCGCMVSDADRDGDGAADCVDQCPEDKNKKQPGVCGCGVAEQDTDGDAVPDCQDECDNNPQKTSAGECGCSVGDTDRDFDGTFDCDDACPDDPKKTSAGACGCGKSEQDRDADGVPDCADECPSDVLKSKKGVCGCGVSETDSDLDAVPDCTDNCVAVVNPDQKDQDHDSIGDACEVPDDGEDTGSSDDDFCSASVRVSCPPDDVTCFVYLFTYPNVAKTKQGEFVYDTGFFELCQWGMKVTAATASGVAYKDIGRLLDVLVNINGTHVQGYVYTDELGNTNQYIDKTLLNCGAYMVCEPTGQ